MGIPLTLTRNVRLRIIVLGFIVRCPSGGLVWHYLQYVKGLADLGHEVYYVEDNCFFEEDQYGWCYHPSTNEWDTNPSEGLEFIKEIFKAVGLGNIWAYHDAQRSRWHGPLADRIQILGANADLLINVSGVNPLRLWLQEIPVRAYIDTDPVFSQVKHLTNPINRTLALQHNRFFSFAENISSPDCTIPNDTFPWRATRQPIVMDLWPFTRGRFDGNFTTVMVWESYKALEYGGIRYGMKSESFKDFIDLPHHVRNELELAVACSPDTERMLSAKGWSIVDPVATTLTPPRYVEFIRRSKAEFTVAKHTYVVTNSGWFSERSAVYLASGRPVLAQETGFSEWLPTGQGLLFFRNMDEAISGIHEINAHYEKHCGAAREIAETYFDARKVLTDLIDLAIGGF